MGRQKLRSFPERGSDGGMSHSEACITTIVLK
jgi:hypothetical protein